MKWNERFQRMKKHYNWTYNDLAKITDNTPESMRSVISTKIIPAWLKLAIYIFEKENDL